MQASVVLQLTVEESRRRVCFAHQFGGKIDWSRWVCRVALVAIET